MNETVENEWIERNKWNRGKPVGFRQYRTNLSGDMVIEEVIPEIEKLMQIRNQKKREGKDLGIFTLELLEDVWFDQKDCLWRYVVSMVYIAASSEIRKKCQAKRK